MKAIIPIRAVRRGVVCAVVLFALGLVTVRVLRAAEKPSAAAPSSNLARDMMGTWVHVGEPGKAGDIPASGGRLKFRTGRHWVLVSSEPRSGLVQESFGGTYTIKANEYAETLDYGQEGDAEYMNKTFRFTVKVEGDTMTQIGIDNPWHEVWKRVK